MKDQRESIDRLAGDENVEFYEIAFAKAFKVVVERSVAPRNRFQAIIKVEHDLVQR